MDQTTNKPALEEQAWEKIIRQIFAKAEADPEYQKKKINPDWMINYIWGKVVPFERDRWRREEMKKNNFTSVIFRLQSIATRFSLPKVTSDDKIKIGQLVLEAYFMNDPTILYTPTVRLIEPEGAMNVNTYPRRFAPVIDSIIFKYFNIKKTEE
jgi:hypothetical protein